MEDKELSELASQLKQPQGTKGIEISEMMHATNIRMTHQSIDRLSVADNDTVLELGHGNCGHLAYLLEKQPHLKYAGLEISELMHDEAKRINKTFIDEGKALFYTYDGQHIPFSENSFDKIFTVNTIYFWSQPESLLTELYRVLKPNGKLNITFAQKSFMEKLPFTRFEFQLYDTADVLKLLQATPFSITGTDSQTEMIKSKMGDMIAREFTTITVEK